MEPLVAMYARVSTERQAEAQTIEQQLEAVRGYAAAQGWAIPPQRIYRDEGYSGARLDRPALDRLRDAVAQGEVDILLIVSPDRLARRYAYQVWLLEEFARAGCQVVFLERPPSDDPQDALVIQIRGAVAEYERTVIADRMRRGRLAALRAGRILPWTTPPFGYRLDPRAPRDPAGVRIEESEAALIRQIFTWYVTDGLTLYGVAKRLTDRGIPTAQGKAIWNATSVRKILLNPCYGGVAYGNQKQMVPARRRHPLIGREPKGAGGESCRLRPVEDWIGVPVPAIVAPDLLAQARERLARNQQWATRNTRGEYLLRCLVSCRRCGRAHHIWNNGHYAYYGCQGLNTLIVRHRPEPCQARRIAIERLDALVWADVCQVLREPALLQEALRRAQQGWLSGDERMARQQDLLRRQKETQRQIERLIDAYAAEVVTLEELGLRRRKLEDRLEALRREGQQLVAEDVRSDHLQAIATGIESFRAKIAQGLEQATFATKRAIVELLIDRVVVDAPEVEIRYVVPLTGAAQRKGVLRSRHRAAQSRGQAAQRRGRDLSQSAGPAPPSWGDPERAARRMADGPALSERGVLGEARAARRGGAHAAPGRQLAEADRPRNRISTASTPTHPEGETRADHPENHTYHLHTRWDLTRASAGAVNPAGWASEERRLPRGVDGPLCHLLAPWCPHRVAHTLLLAASGPCTARTCGLHHVAMALSQLS
jgi:site-specific DNA recombinase